MERKNKACWNCQHYKAYYTKGFCHFDRKALGVCTEKRATVNKNELCKNWCPITYSYPRKKLTLRALDEILNELSQIKQILLEGNEKKS